MNSINRTLYIPLRGKAYVSRRGLFLRDEKAETLWDAAAFPLRGKSASRWLAFYMGIRAAVFDDWLRSQMAAHPDAVILHPGCGLDSRALRVGTSGHPWYDVDMAQVMDERRLYFAETDDYRMLSGDLRDPAWLAQLPDAPHAIVVMEGVNMYLAPEELRAFLAALQARYPNLSLLMDCYTPLAARLSSRGNPVKDVGVTQVHGVEDPHALASGGLAFLREHDMTPTRYIDQLRGAEKLIFRRMYAGGLSRKLYRLYEYGTQKRES